MSDNSYFDLALDFYKSIFESSLDAILLTRPDGTIFYVNSAAQKLYGYTQKEICDLGRSGIVDTNDPNLQVILDERARLGKSKGELILIKKDGSKFPGEVSTSIFKDKNGNVNTFMTIRDITQRKQNEKQIQYHALLLNKVNDAVIGTNSNFIITYWNNGAELMYGFTEKEAIGKSSVELLRPTYAPGERERIINELNNKGSSKSIISTKNRNGTEIIVEVNSSRILDEQKNISGYVVVYRDITERKLAENRKQELLESEKQLTEELQTSNEELQSVTEELRISNEELQYKGEGLIHVNQALLESEKRMNRSQEIAHLGSWELDIDNNCLSWSDEVYRIFGLQPQEFDATYDAFLDNVHPNDREAVDEAYSGSIRDGQDTYEIEHRIVRKSNGEVRIVHEKCEHFRDITGRIIRSVGMVHDITERKLAEQALIESEIKYRSLYSSMSEGVALHEIIYNLDQDPVDYIIADINQSYEDITGLNRSEVVGKKASELYGIDEPPYMEIYARVAETGEPIQFETYFEPMDKYFNISVTSPEKGKFYTIFEDITKRKRTEEELNNYREHLESLVEIRTEELENSYESLKESEEHYLTLFNSIDEGFCTVEVIFDSRNKPVDYKFLEVNPAFEGQTGLINATGKLMRDLAPDHEEHWFEIYGKVALTGQSTRFVNEAKALNRWYDVYAFKVGDIESREVAILFNDITKFTETESALKLSNIYNRSLIEASLDPLVTIGSNGKITDVNTSTENVIGIKREELIGTDFSDYFTEPKKAREGYMKVFKDGFVVNYPLEIKNKNGNITPVEYNASVYKNEFGEVIGVFAAARDITGMKNAEQKLKEYQDTLEDKVEKRTQELARSNKELEQFAYITSHDLREPLRMITSFLQLLERRYKDQLDQDANEFIGFAVDGAKRLDRMTNDLLLYSRITSQKREITPVNFEEVLGHALTNLKVPIEENNAIITHDPLPTIKGDEQLKVQLFQNIVGNAIKYRSQENPKIHISATKEKNQYLFSIKDNGIGISPEHLERIFTIFQRLHTHDEYEGTGIGLAIAQKIVHQQGGQIWAESELGKGTTFYFTIPIKS